MDVKNLSDTELETLSKQWIKENPNRTPIETVRNPYQAERMIRAKK
jgi:hypothetical protein